MTSSPTARDEVIHHDVSSSESLHGVERGPVQTERQRHHLCCACEQVNRHRRAFKARVFFKITLARRRERKFKI